MDPRYARLKEMLDNHRRRLQQSLSVRLEEIRLPRHDGKIGEALDIADASASDLDQYFGVAMAEMASETLRHVERALVRLERGEYGLCVECNDAIADQRLAALPFALRCRACEERHEGDQRARRVSPRSHQTAVEP